MEIYIGPALNGGGMMSQEDRPNPNQASRRMPPMNWREGATRNILTFLSHFFAGVITILSTLISPTISIILFLTFIIYEVTEDWRLNDKSFRDIREFGYGAFLTAVILIILKVVT